DLPIYFKYHTSCQNIEFLRFFLSSKTKAIFFYTTALIDLLFVAGIILTLLSIVEKKRLSILGFCNRLPSIDFDIYIL
ncbi:MAG: hypothetical protein ABF294_02410, partial [Flavobacteriales bacterium]